MISVKEFEKLEKVADQIEAERKSELIRLSDVKDKEYYFLHPLKYQFPLGRMSGADIRNYVEKEGLKENEIEISLINYKFWEK